MENGKNIVLLADEDAGYLTREASWLNNEGFIIKTAESAAEVSEILKNPNSIDIIVIDINLCAEENGVCSAAEIQTAYNIPLIILSETNSPEIREMIDRIAAYGYVFKSSGAGTLAATIKMALKLHKSRAELRDKEKDLFEIEKRYFAIYNASSIGIVKYDFEGNFIDANSAFQQMVGYSDSELRKMSWNDITHPNDKEKSSYHYVKMKNGELNYYTIEKRYIHKNRTTVWVNANVVAIEDEEGRPAFEFGIITDITTKKETEYALLESESRFRELFDEAPIGYHEIDRNGILTRVNQTELRLLGYSDPKEMLGQHVSNFVAQTEQSKKELQKKLDGKLIVGNTYRRDFKRKDGRKIPVAVCDRLILARNGDLTGIRSTIQDISDIKKAEDALIKSETKYRNIFENVQDVYYRTDINGIITEISPSIKRHTGRNIDSFLGGPVEEIYQNPEDRKKFLEALAVKGEVNDYELLLKGFNKNPLFVSVNAHFLYDDDGTITGVEGSLRDITERKNAELKIAEYAEELKNLNATKDKFFSIIAHDLKNPFNSILILAEMFASQIEIFPPEELKELSEELFKSAGHVYKLLEDLLEWSRVESGRMPFIPQNLYCWHEIDLVIKLLAKSAERKRIILENNAPKTSMVYADSKMLQMTLRNLISNAIKFSYENSRIIIEVAHDENETLFKVSDTGVGIPDDSIDKLFKLDVYYSTEGTNNEKGTGLGLILCYDIIKKHNGKIWVESSPGKGSSFFFSIPALQ
jgi:PAS domain S-box-containing protein